MSRRIAWLAAAVLVLAVATPFGALGQQKELDLDGETEAFALRVEYDIPLPAGSGTIPGNVGEIRKESGENAKGLAAAPTQFDALVSGAVYDPYAAYNGNDGNFHVGSVYTDQKPPINPHNQLPTAECFYPGATSKTVSWPRDLRAEETKPLPPVAYANAQCNAGPTTQITAWAASADTPAGPGEPIGAVVHTGPVAGESLLRPDHGAVKTFARASANAVKILGGVIRIGSVEVEGASSAEGPGGTAGTSGHVALIDVEAGGQKFTVADNHLTIAGQTFAIPSDGAQAAMNAINAGLDPTGCKLTLLGPAEKYPQGYILARKPPKIGVAKDGTFAASMHGGMLVFCDIPKSITEPTTFTPQRAQILVGFAYSMAKANTASEGFGIGDLAGPTTINTPSKTISEVSRSVRDVDAPAAPEAGRSTDVTNAPQAFTPSRRVIPYTPLGMTARVIFILIGVALLIAATNLASRRLKELVGS